MHIICLIHTNWRSNKLYIVNSFTEWSITFMPLFHIKNFNVLKIYYLLKTLLWYVFCPNFNTAFYDWTIFVIDQLFDWSIFVIDWSILWLISFVIDQFSGCSIFVIDLYFVIDQFVWLINWLISAELRARTQWAWGDEEDPSPT